MAKDLGYKPAKGPDGSGNYKHSGSPEGKGQMHARSKKRQDGVNADKGSLNAGDHLHNADGAVNPDVEKYC